MYRFYLKRIIDIIVSVLALTIISPVFILAGIFLFFNNNGRIFFIQKRPGKNNKIFKIIKFKTMNDKRDVNGVLLPDHVRLTRVGRIVRKFSIDELPQLINVIKGDMSLIGPRPLLVEYLKHYNNEQNKRHNIRPGITGWAQVNGRNAISWKKKFELDVYYVNNISFVLDIKIIYLTILKVLKSEGINKEGQATTEPFNGTN